MVPAEAIQLDGDKPQVSIACSNIPFRQPMNRAAFSIQEVLLSRRDLAKQRRREQYSYVPAIYTPASRPQIATKKVAARACGLEVAAIKAPASLTPDEARRLSDDGLAYRLEQELTLVEYVLPNSLRYDDPTRFEDAVSAYDRRMGWKK